MYDSYSRAVFTFISHLTWTDADPDMYSLYTETKATLDRIDKQSQWILIVNIQKTMMQFGEMFFAIFPFSCQRDIGVMYISLNLNSCYFFKFKF